MLRYKIQTVLTIYSLDKNITCLDHKTYNSISPDTFPFAREGEWLQETITKKRDVRIMQLMIKMPYADNFTYLRLYKKHYPNRRKPKFKL